MDKSPRCAETTHQSKAPLRLKNYISLSLILIVCIKFSDFEQVKFSVY